MLADIFPTSCNVLHQILDRKVFQVLHLILSLDKNRDENVQVQEKSPVKIKSKQNLVIHLCQFSEKQVICPILGKKKLRPCQPVQMHNQSSIQSSLKPAQSLGANLVEVQASSKGFSTARISPQNHSCVGFGQ